MSEFDKDPVFMTVFDKLKFISDMREAMRSQKIGAYDLAYILETHKEYITGWLKGRDLKDLTICELSEIACALDRRLEIRLVAPYNPVSTQWQTESEQRTATGGAGK